MTRIDRRDLLLLATFLAMGWCFAARSYAGGGPENVFLVVNANSDASKEIANHYVRLRNLPASNVLYLDYKGDLERINGGPFRKQILQPVLAAIQSRGLSLQIDIIAYSSDFPWRIHFSDDLPKGTKLPTQNTPVASLTGATYLWQFLLTKSLGTVVLDSNWYVPEQKSLNAKKCRKLETMPSHAFRSRYAWKKGGTRANDPKSGRRYYLSTMLGVTTGRGNSTEEVIGSLRRAIYAEITPPSGTFYYVKNSGIRSTTRDGCYPAAVEALHQLGAKAVVVQGKVPRDPKAIAGMMLGAEKLKLAGLEIEPGALCEHLTSYGGDLRKRASQTPLTDLIRAGAAGASGTVYEPLAIQAKFPLPSLHVHYRRGSSLAEAFYQSVASPYQLLIVGDPLCQPWARRPTLEVAGWPLSEEPLTDGPSEKDPPQKLIITPRVVFAAEDPTDPPKNPPKAYWELFIDGQLRMRLPSGTSFGLQPEGLGPGWHELRCVGFDPGPLEFQGQVVGSLETARLKELPLVQKPVDPKSVEQEPPKPEDLPTEPEPLAEPERLDPVRLTSLSLVTSLDGQVKLRATAPGAERIEIRQNSRVVGKIKSDGGTIEIGASLLGRGPVRLQAVAQPEGAASAPIQLVIQ